MRPLILSLILLWTSCAIAFSEGESASYRMALIVQNNNTYWEQIISGMQDAARDLNVSPTLLEIYRSDDICTTLFPPACAVDIARYADMDAIITLYDSDETFQQHLEEARDQDIVTVYVDCDGENRDLYVGTDNYAAGVQAAQTLNLHMQNTGAILIPIRDTAQKSNYCQRIAGIEDSLSKENQHELVLYRYEDVFSASTVQMLKTYLEAHPEITAIISLSEGRTLSLAQMIRRENWQERITLLGFDMIPELIPFLEDGSVDYVIAQQPYEIGYRSIERAYAWLCGDHSGASECYIETLVIDDAESGNR